VVQIRSGRICRTGGFVHNTLSARYAKRPGQWSGVLRGDGGDCEPHPWGSPLRALRYGADLRSSKFVPSEFVEPEWVRPQHPLRQIRKTPRTGRFAYLAERVGFEPTVRLHVRLISSAPSGRPQPLEWQGFRGLNSLVTR